MTLRRSEYEFTAREEFRDGETVWDFAERLKNRVAPDGTLEGVHLRAEFVDASRIGDPHPTSIPGDGRWVLLITETVEDDR